jgi:hypothetical protein
VKTRLRRLVELWIDLFAKHELLDHTSAIAFQLLKPLIPVTLRGQRGVLNVLFGSGK